MSEPLPAWEDVNRQYLMTRIAAVRLQVERLGSNGEGDGDSMQQELTALDARARELGEAMTPEPALDHLSRAFSLSPFERDVLLLCAGVALDPTLAAQCAEAHQDADASHPTFLLAIAAFRGDHWTALTPTAPLRKWQLVQLSRGDTLLSSPLRIDERVLHHLLGISYLDTQCGGVVTPVRVPATLPRSYRAAAERMAALWTSQAAQAPIIHLSTETRGDERALTAAACAAIGLRLHVLRAADVPLLPSERDTLARLWERESLLGRSALLLDFEDADPQMVANGRSLLERLDALLIVTGGAPIDRLRQLIVRVDAGRPSNEDQRTVWSAALGPLAERLNGQLDAVSSQFHLGADAIAAAVETVRARGAADAGSSDAGVEDAGFGAALWDACRVQARRALDGLAERIDTRARWEDLVLPDDQKHTLREITAHVRQRRRVYETWGFAANSARGLGISALFAGPSGTGKTLAAEVVAASLRLDLYRIDLSQVVSKYIGETEKALRRLFDAAELSGAVLLFDEADALFGKRSEIRDSHDRYANLEVSYLLQRMDSYRGLAILTTNRRNALDAAFLRRLRFIVSFPFPDFGQRARIWQRIFPAETPTDGLDVHKLARLNVAGGSIRNIAMNAAFLAADEGEPVRMRHLLSTARSECAKLEKPLSAAEVGTWV